MATKDMRAQAERALAAPFTGDGATVEKSAAPGPSIVMSTRLDPELSRWVAAEADRRGVKPSVVIRDAVSEAAEVSRADQPVTIRRGDLLRAVDRVVTSMTRPAAA